MPTQEFIIDVEPGHIRFVYDDAVYAALKNIGTASINRASRVEPVLGRWWQVDMAPVDGPVFEGLFYYRNDALEAERLWLESHLFGDGSYDPFSRLLIYALIDEQGTLRYVGKSNNVRRRFKTHQKEKGWPHAFVVLETVTEETWPEREKHWIAEFRLHSAMLLENITDGGSAPPGFAKGTKLGDQHRLNISKGLTGRKLSPSHREKVLVPLQTINHNLRRRSQGRFVAEAGTNRKGKKPGALRDGLRNPPKGSGADTLLKSPKLNLTGEPGGVVPVAEHKEAGLPRGTD